MEISSHRLTIRLEVGKLWYPVGYKYASCGPNRHYNYYKLIYNPASRVSRNLMLFDFSNFAIIKLLWTNSKNFFLLQSPKKQMYRCVSLANTGYKIRNRNWKRVTWNHVFARDMIVRDTCILEMVQEINLWTVNSLIMTYLQEIYTSGKADESEYVCQIRYPPRLSPKSHAPCE